MSTFTPPKPPSVGGQGKDVQFRTLVNNFGDGYSQRAEDGLNAVGRTVTLTWNTLTNADADTIENFFLDQKGVTSFDYQLPKESVSRKWVCGQFGRGEIDADHSSMTAVLTLVYDI